MRRARSILARSLVALVLMGGGATACEASRYDHIEIYRTGGHPEARVTASGLLVPEGGVLVFEAQPYAETSSPQYEGLERFSLRSSSPDVARVHRTILADTWVVGGMAVGDVQLHVLIDGEVVDEVPVEILVNPGEAP